MNYRGLGADRESGITFVGFLLNCALIVFAALVGMRLFPLYSESMKVKTAMESIKNLPEVSTMSAREVEKALLKRFDIDDISRFDQNTLRDVFTIEPAPEKNSRIITMNYEMRGPLFGNLDIVLKFNESRTIAGTASD